jgi:hypothetical protein
MAFVGTSSPYLPDGRLEGRITKNGKIMIYLGPYRLPVNTHLEEAPPEGVLQ